ncbi:MAG: transcription antitermination factor NusB [Eubacteriales bacterium]|nr:transcription antitermination factor NusB [Eubacteriales bacterium]
MRRQTARELAIHLLYQFDVKDISISEIQPGIEAFIGRCVDGEYALFEGDQYRAELPKKASDLTYSRAIVESVIDNFESVDDLLDHALRGWQIERIPFIERAILRVALAEILFQDTPTSVAINEALIMVKKYCNDESYAYVNAVLAKIASDLNLEAKGRIDLDCQQEGGEESVSETVTDSVDDSSGAAAAEPVLDSDAP